MPAVTPKHVDLLGLVAQPHLRRLLWEAEVNLFV